MPMTPLPSAAGSVADRSARRYHDVCPFVLRGRRAENGPIGTRGRLPRFSLLPKSKPPIPPSPPISPSQADHKHGEFPPTRSIRSADAPKFALETSCRKRKVTSEPTRCANTDAGPDHRTLLGRARGYGTSYMRGPIGPTHTPTTASHLLTSSRQHARMVRACAFTKAGPEGAGTTCRPLGHALRTLNDDSHPFYAER